jgi:hypothetical protein
MKGIVNKECGRTQLAVVAKFDALIRHLPEESEEKQSHYWPGQAVRVPGG